MSATYHGITEIKCEDCTFITTDEVTMEVINDQLGECPACASKTLRFSNTDGSVLIVAEDENGEQFVTMVTRATTEV
jgi:Zn finger protein HypA/HybF involved in hydrogenase expression